MRDGTRLLSAAALVAFGLPTAALAQDRPMYRPMYELPSITVTALSESDPLYESASRLYQAGDWEGAAQLYRDAAESLPKNDENSYVTFDQAARLYFYAGDYSEARKMMEQAATVAEATGDMLSAAYRHVDAAFIAVWEGYPGQRRDHVATAEKYAAEHDFSDADVARIQALTRGVGLLPVREE